MFTDISQSIQSALGDNQFLSGGFLLMLMGAVMASLRNVPKALGKFLLAQCTVKVEIRSRPVIFWLDAFLREHGYSRHCRRLKTEIVHRKGPDDEDIPAPTLVPGMGLHLVRHDRRWFLIHRKLEQQDGSNNSGGVMDLLRQETATIYTLWRQSGPIQRLLEASRDEAFRDDDDRVRTRVNRHGDWCTFHSTHLRPLESVVLAGGIAEDLREDLTEFLSPQRKAWYRQRGIPYRRGYLLEGPPGGGKSSLVAGIANELRLSLHVLDLTEEKLTDVDLVWLLALLPQRAVVLVEDIDCVPIAQSRSSAEGSARESRSGDSRVTLTGLLNAIDGVVAAEGRILFCTTNHPKQMDPALLRPGRIDRRFWIGPATDDQAKRLFQRFFPESNGLAQRFAEAVNERPRETSMAELQSLLIQHSQDPVRALRAAERNLLEDE